MAKCQAHNRWMDGSGSEYILPCCELSFPILLFLPLYLLSLKNTSKWWPNELHDERKWGGRTGGLGSMLHQLLFCSCEIQSAANRVEAERCKVEITECRATLTVVSLNMRHYSNTRCERESGPKNHQRLVD